MIAQHDDMIKPQINISYFDSKFPPKTKFLQSLLALLSPRPFPLRPPKRSGTPATGTSQRPEQLHAVQHTDGQEVTARTVRDGHTPQPPNPAVLAPHCPTLTYLRLLATTGSSLPHTSPRYT